MQGVSALDGAMLMIGIVTARNPIVRPVVMPKIENAKRAIAMKRRSDWP